MNKKLIWIVIVSLVLSANVYAGGVTDNNAGQQGQVLVSTGENNGANSIGTWTDPTDIDGLKGDKGDPGEPGAQGEQGIQGIQGISGENGKNGDQGEQGLPGINGVDGKDGQQGDTGDPGLNGADGKDGINGLNGQDGVPGVKGDKGDIGTQGEKGNKGDKGERGLQGVQGKGLKDQYKVGVEAVIAETARTSWRMYYNRDVNNNTNEFGVRVVVYIGKSYSQKQMEKLQTQLKQLADKVEGRI